MGKKSIFATGWEWFAHASQAYQIAAWLLPAGAISVMTGFWANISGQQGWAAIVIGVVTLAFLLFAIASFYTFKLRRFVYLYETSIEGKLEYTGTYLGADFLWDDAKQVKSIASLNIGINLINKSKKKLFYRVDQFHARMAGQAPETDKFVGRMQELPSGMVASTYPDAIVFGKDGVVDPKGTLEFTLSYGDNDASLDFEISKKMEIDIFIKRDQSIFPNGLAVPSIRDKI